jgi:hypothetical protein
MVGDIFGHLFQIQPHIGDLVIGGKGNGHSSTSVDKDSIAQIVKTYNRFLKNS